MSVRNDIMASLIDSLRTWAKENDRNIKTIQWDHPNETVLRATQHPSAFFLDVTEDELLVEDDEAIRFRTPVIIRGFVAERDEASLHEVANILYDDLREWILAEYLLHESVLKLQFRESSDGRFAADEAASFVVRCELTYIYTKAVA